VRSRNAGPRAAMNMMAGPVTGYRLPCLSAEHAALARNLSRRRFTRNLGGFDLQVVAPPDVIVDPVALDMLPNAQVARVTIPRPLLYHLLETLDPAAPGAVPDVACLLLELYLEPLLTRLETYFPSLEVRLSPADDATPCAAFAIGLAVRHGTMAETLRLDLDLAAGRSVAAVLAHLPDWRGVMPDLPIRLHLRALTADVSLVELRATRPGDVVLADALPDGEILVVAGECFAWRARRDGPRLQIVTPRLRPRVIGLERWAMNDAIEPNDAADLDELPVRLSFELGRLELPLAEVAVLGPGHVFELAREETQPVDILANGRRIGRGRIVTVAGSIGVQVLRIGRE
jgi:type III secretion protein Q